ncbi:hypothetical protein PSE10B_51400 [Pseudomonas amygdali pv. eriobotryae]|nr:hypothetical protein PSE10B_51400 [Pseudomonas amygdali pv. eriobotryae]
MQLQLEINVSREAVLAQRLVQTGCRVAGTVNASAQGKDLRETKETAKRDLSQCPRIAVSITLRICEPLRGLR